MAKPGANGVNLNATQKYLAVYNLVCAFLWTMVLGFCSQNIIHYERDPVLLWDRVEGVLKLVQTAAVMEIIHAMLGMVRSNVFSTFLQVFSRVGVLWGAANISPYSQANPLLIMMITSWAVVEVPRYCYYLTNIVAFAMPPVLHSLRYSLFMVLYPTGITGEIGVILSALSYVNEHPEVFNISLPNEHNLSLSYSLLLVLALLAYLPGSPFMYSHMLRQRKSANRKFAEDNKFIGSSYSAGRKVD